MGKRINVETGEVVVMKSGVAGLKRDITTTVVSTNRRNIIADFGRSKNGYHMDNFLKITDKKLARCGGQGLRGANPNGEFEINYGDFMEKRRTFHSIKEAVDFYAQLKTEKIMWDKTRAPEQIFWHYWVAIKTEPLKLIE